MLHKSPSKILRDVIRISKFNEKKSRIPVLSIMTLQSISIPPEPQKKCILSISKTCHVDIIPMKNPKTLAFSQPTLTSLLPTLPEPSLHPYIVEASKMLYGKPPWELTAEQSDHFEGYQEYKIRSGLPIEDDICYKPREDPT